MKATALSRTNKTTRPLIKNPMPTPDTLVKGDLIKVINKCPATRLAASRTERVKGRIKFLTNSIKTITGIKT